MVGYVAQTARPQAVAPPRPNRDALPGRNDPVGGGLFGHQAQLVERDLLVFEVFHPPERTDAHPHGVERGRNQARGTFALPTRNNKRLFVVVINL